MSLTVWLMMIKYIAIALVDAINSQDYDAVRQLMMTDALIAPHQAIVSNYQIHVEHIICDCQRVVLTGQAISCHERVSAVWVAQICGQRIIDWQVYFSGTPTCAN